jgi:hypothetical protein
VREHFAVPAAKLFACADGLRFVAMTCHATIMPSQECPPRQDSPRVLVDDQPRRRSVVRVTT